MRKTIKEKRKMEKATFGAGCFWGIEDAFRQINGVSSTQVGFMGGDKNNPSYEEVCRKKTGHIEVVEVTYDSQKTSYEVLLKLFWESINPTQQNGQGPDIGSQYRTIIFYHTPAQKEEAEESKTILQKKYSEQIATTIEPASTFFRAEEYHQQYFEKQGIGGRGVCH